MSTLYAENETTGAAPAAGRLSWSQRFRNNWPVVPMRIFLGALFLFAGFAKFSYPGFFDDNNQTGLEQLMQRAKPDSPIRSALSTIIDHASLLGHVTAYAEFAIGAGLVVGLLTRIAALGGIVLTTLIALSYNWDSIKEYTAISGWFTSVDIAVAVALTVFVLGGAGPLSFDRLFSIMQDRRDAREDAEPGFADTDPEESRRRLQAQPGVGAAAAGYATPATYPVTPPVPTADQATSVYQPVPAYQAPSYPAPSYPPAPTSPTPVSPGPVSPPPVSPPPVSPPPVSPPPASPPPSAPAYQPADNATQQLPVTPAAPTPPPTDSYSTQGYPALKDDLEHDEANEVEAEPRGRVDES